MKFSIGFPVSLVFHISINLLIFKKSVLDITSTFSDSVVLLLTSKCPLMKEILNFNVDKSISFSSFDAAFGIPCKESSSFLRDD